jgi:hypothetical protein
MAGLLGDIFGAADTAKRKLRDVVANPLLSAQQFLGNVNDRARNLNEMTAAAALEGVDYGPASQRLGGLLADAYNPVGMTMRVPGLLDTTYRSSHKAPNREFGAPLHDLTGGGQMYPADVYSPKAAQYYGTGYPMADKQAFDLARRVRGNPNAEVTMYRAVPKDPSISSINAGDWVTLSKDYAKTHGESALMGNYKIISQKVKAKDLWTNADSIHEFGYSPD